MGEKPTDAELRARLTPGQCHISRTGIYLCVVCGEDLFFSAALDFKPGSGP